MPIGNARAPDPRPTPTGLDPRIPRFNQGATGLLLALAFAADLQSLVPVTGLILGLGALFGIRWNLWAQVFLHIVRPLLRLGPPQTRKDPAPTRFALTLGTIFLAAASIVLLLVPGDAASLIGWTLALVVAALALLAAATDICIGCILYTTAIRLRSSDRRAEPVE